MASALKRKLSGSTDGMPILISGTAIGEAQTVHTAVAGTTPGTFDEIWMWVHNSGTASSLSTVDIMCQFGADTSKERIEFSVPARSGFIPILPGMILQNGATVKVFAKQYDSASALQVAGFVNYITD